MISIKFNGKPIEKLIETVSSGIGVLYNPRAIKKEADAVAYKMVVLEEAKAKCILIAADSDVDVYKRVTQRLFHQEVSRQINLDNVIEKTIGYLNDSVSEVPVDKDWRTKFFVKVQDVTNEDLQNLWSKVLANELSKPGLVSLRTLDVLSNLSKAEAEVFQRAASISIEGGHILKFSNENSFDGFGVSYNDLLTLRAANLIFDSDTLNLNFNFIDDISGAYMNFGNKTISFSNSSTKIYVFNQIAFTPSGTELMNTLNFEMNYLYLEKFIEDQSKHGYTFVTYDV